MSITKRTRAPKPVPVPVVSQELGENLPPRRRGKRLDPSDPRARKGRGSRSKGNAYEVEVAHMLEHVYPDAQRGKQQTRNGHDAPDVVRTPWWWECKSYKGQYPARKALGEAIADSAKHGGGMVPVCAIRQTRARPDLFVMRLEDGIALMARAERAEARVRELEARLKDAESALALAELDA